MADISTLDSAAAWHPDLSVFAPEDAVPNALILDTTTRAGEIDGDAPAVRCAYVNDDEAVFKAEGAELDEAAPALSEAVVYTGKITQLVRISMEQYLQDHTGQHLAQSVERAIVRRADLAFVSEPAPTPPANAPATGLVNVAGLTEGDPVFDSLDALIDLVAELEDNDATPSHILVDPKGWAELRKLKTGTDFNSTLLGAGTTDATPLLLSLPVLVNKAVPDYTGIILDRTAIVSAYGDVRVATSMDQYFSSDSVALRATWRIGHTVVRPERIGRFTIADESS